MFFSGPLPDAATDHLPALQRLVVVVETLDIAWGLFCCPLLEECRQFERRKENAIDHDKKDEDKTFYLTNSFVHSNKEQQQSSNRAGQPLGDDKNRDTRRRPFEMKMIKSYLVWLEKVVDLLGYAMSKEADPPKSYLEGKFATRLHTFCHLTIRR